MASVAPFPSLSKALRVTTQSLAAKAYTQATSDCGLMPKYLVFSLVGSDSHDSNLLYSAYQEITEGRSLLSPVLTSLKYSAVISEYQKFQVYPYLVGSQKP